MQRNIYQLSVILVLLQSHAAEYQFVSASPHLAVQERMKVQCVAVVATGEPAHYGFQKSKGNTGQAADGAGHRAHRGLVIDDVHPTHGALDGGEVAQIAVDDLEPIAGTLREVQVFAPARREVIEDLHLHAVPQEPFDDVRSDEAGTARDEA